MKKVLILGAGKVARPIVRYLLKKHRVTLASNFLYQTEQIINKHPHGKTVEWQSNDIQMLESMINKNDLVISLLPYPLHYNVCMSCIKLKKNLITTSYEQPEMKKLRRMAQRAKVIILNEMGLDPGIDHMWSLKMINEIREQGGKVEKFISICGALPSPESLDNPLRYKFSWSPEGVLRASKSKAVFLKQGRKHKKDASNLMLNTLKFEISNIGEMEAYPNRDSLKYQKEYNLKDANTFFRGTLRFKGWCESLSLMHKIGYLSEISFPESINTYKELTNYLLHQHADTDCRDYIINKFNLEPYDNSIQSMEWLGFFSNQLFSKDLTSPFDLVVNKMDSKMKLLPSDKDLVVLLIQMLITDKNNIKKIVRGTLIKTGIDYENTAIADTVSYPAAIAAELLLNDLVPQKGIIKPFYKEIYMPVLTRLKDELGFKFEITELKEDSWPENW